MRMHVRIPALLLTAAGATFLAYKYRKFQPAALFSAFTISSSSTSIVANVTMSRGSVIALSHGGGPMPVLGDPASEKLADSMRTRVPQILGFDDPARRPKAIVLVTAHWSTDQPTVSSGRRHSLYYDYGGFPAEAYRLKYDAPGSPEVAARYAELLREEGLKPRLDDSRGWDHGVFVPLLLARPQADIPVVQASVLRSEDPAAHFAMGRALRRLRDEGVAVVGSGFASFHNIRLMFSGITQEPVMREKLSEWNAAVTAAASVAGEHERDERFRQWRSWPAAYVTHPNGGAEHFLPLIVCAGAAGDVAAKSYVDSFLGMDIYSYYWE